MMKRTSVAALAGALLVATSTAALAIDVTARVRSVIEDDRILLLDIGDKVIVPEDFDISTVKAGMLVEVSYDNTGDGPYTVTSITIATMPAAPPAGAADGAADDDDAADDAGSDADPSAADDADGAAADDDNAADDGGEPAEGDDEEAGGG
jgi:hypothetical protein